MVGDTLASTRWVASLLSAALLFAACTASQPEASPSRASPSPDSAPSQVRTGGGMTVAATTDAVSFHPFKTTDSASTAYQGLVYAGGLVVHDPRSPDKFIPWLAESWAVADDGVTYTFHLRPDIRWSDGHPITSADFKWTFDQALKPENQYPYASNFEPIVGYEAPDPADGRRHAQRADGRGPRQRRRDWAAAEARLGASGLERRGQKPRDHGADGGIRDPSSSRSGSATRTQRSWRTSITSRAGPSSTRYTVRIVGTQAGGVPGAARGRGRLARAFDPTTTSKPSALDNVTVYEWWPAATTWSYLGFNLRKPYLQDVRVRRALAYAIDRQLIIDQIQYGLARRPTPPIPPSCWCYNPDVPRPRLRSRPCARAAGRGGLGAGSDGVVRPRTASGCGCGCCTARTTAKCASGSATVAQEEFRQVGVDVEIQGLEWAAFLHAIKTPPFDWDMTVLGWSSTVDPHWMYQIWSEKNIPDLNAGAYVNKRVEELFQEGAREFDPRTGASAPIRRSRGSCPTICRTSSSR